MSATATNRPTRTRHDDGPTTSSHHDLRHDLHIDVHLDVHLDVRGVTRTVGDVTILHPVSFFARRGEVVAIAGGSGAGKSTLLDVIAGNAPADDGELRVDGRVITADPHVKHCGYVPQDDIVHGDLSVARTLRYASELRLGGSDERERSTTVQRVLSRVGLSDHASVDVGSLSGGQRKRVCIAAELLAEPDLFVLDEPTSGLDPASAAAVMQQLRALAGRGATVVLTTHSPADLDRCDRVVFLAPGGRHVFTGTASEARHRFDVEHLSDAYARMEVAPSLRSVRAPAAAAPPAQAGDIDTSRVAGGWWRQWTTSTARTAELIVRNHLTLAILVGSPVFVIAMLAGLFRPGAIDVTQSTSAAQVVFWVVFSAFFFGLTYGLLQIVTERAIFRRERAAGLRVTAYVAAKVTVLLPFLAVVDLGMLWVLELSGQLPDTSSSDTLRLWGVLTVVSAAALAVGLAASALVRTPAQATLALPMLCFPQVLFAGSVVPTSEMAVPGRLFSATLVGRWGFESFGRTLGLGRWFVDGSTSGFAATFEGSGLTGIGMLAGIAFAGIAITLRALRNG